MAVLNLELLRMRLRKIVGEDDDEKIADYTRAIETELRRLGHIFDAFFLLSTPPKNDERAGRRRRRADRGRRRRRPASIELDADERLPSWPRGENPAGVQAVLRGRGEAASATRPAAPPSLATTRRSQSRVTGQPGRGRLRADENIQVLLHRPEGNPDLSLAVARLIAETYGGELDAAEDRDKVSLRLSFPLGDE